MTDTTIRGGSAPFPRGKIATDLARETAARISRVARNMSYRTWPYRLSLSGPMPDRILCFPQELASSSIRQSKALMEGRYVFPGGTVQTKPSTAPWRLVPPNESWAESLHGFSWIRHFQGRQDQPAKQHIHWLVASWLESCGRWDDVAWRPHVSARRLISWFTHGRLVLQDADMIWRSALLRSMAFQARHLERTAKLAAEGEPRMTAAIGLCLSGVCLPDGLRRLERGMQLLRREIDKQILADGSHISRNPHTQLTILIDILTLKDALIIRKRPVPDILQETIELMVPVLRFFRHGDGRLALFNGATEGEPGAIEAVLARHDTKARAQATAPVTGYHRLTAARTKVIVDTGRPPKGPFSTHAHAGCLSFEMSAGQHRLIVNCGSTPIRGEQWLNASRTTAAHSTVTLADRSSARFLKRPMTERLLGPRIADGPTNVSSHREESERGVWLSASHNGYVRRFGITHERRFYLSADGEELRGEDKLVPSAIATGPLGFFAQERPAVPFTLRFHLHPGIRASLARDGTRVLLMLPNGDGWQFRTNGPNISLDQSIYLGSGDAVRRSHQIVVSGVADNRDACSVKWAIHRLSRKSDQE